MAIKELLFNFSLILSASVFANLIDFSRLKNLRFKIFLIGIIFGLISIVGMKYPLKLAEGLIFDGRSIILSVSSLFYGPICGITAGLLSAAYRIYIGGPGALVGVLVIFESIVVGLLFNYLSTKKKITVNNFTLIFLNLIVHIIMYLLMFLLPFNFRGTVLTQLREAILIIYPVVGFIIGKIFWLQAQFKESANLIRASEEKFSTIFHKTTIPFILIDASSKIITDVNETFLGFFGFSRNEILGKSLEEINLFTRKDLDNFIIPRLNTTGSIKNIELSVVVNADKQVDLIVNAEKFEIDGKGYILMSFYDLSVQKESIREILRLTSLYSLLSEVNELIVVTKNEEELLEKICEIAVREGNFKFVWIAELEQNKRTIKRYYYAGKIDIDLNNLILKINKNSTQDSLIIKSILNGKYQIVNDLEIITNVEAMLPELVQFGIKSVASFPLKVFNNVSYTIIYYSSIKNFFDSAEIALLDEISKDISYALEAIENDAKRRKAEADLQENLRFLQTLINNLPGFIYRCLNDRDWTMEYLTHQVEEITGYKPEDFIHNRTLAFNDIIHPDFRELLWEKWQRILAEKSVFEHEYQIITKSGEVKWVWERGRGIYNEKGEVIALEGFITDVTERVNFRQKLIESNEKLRLLVEGTPYFFFYTHDHEGRITYISPSVENITGHKVEEWVGTNHWFLTDNPINEKTRINTRKLLKGEKGEYPVYLEIFHKNGSKIILEIFEIPNYKEDKIIGLHGIARDVTIEKKFQDQLIKSEERFRKLFEEHSAVKLIIDPETGKIIDANKSAVKFYGYSINELKSLSIFDISTRDKKELMEGINKVVRGEENYFETKHKLKDGSLKDVAIFSSNVEIDGRNYLLVIVLDITEAKRFERELLFEKTKFQQLFENSPIAIALVDKHEKIQIDNQQFKKFFNFHNNEEIGQSISEVCCSYEMDALNKNFFIRLFRGEKIIKETYLKKKDGSLAYVQIMGVPIFLDVEIIGVFVLIVDITKIKEAEESMKAAKEMAEMASKMKDTFIANISHEIRTPLNAILGYSDLVREAAEQLLKESERNYFNVIKSAGNRLMRTIEMIMNYSRIVIGDFPVKKQKINLTQLIQSLYEEFKYTATLKNLEFEFKNECGEVFINADNYCVTQAIANIIDNAVKYTKRGSVKIHLKRDKQKKLLLEVSDTGIGISKKYQERLFEPYTQQELGWNRPYEGVGLGLALVKRYLNLNNIDISFYSKEGFGSSFYIHFGETEVDG